MTQKDGVMIFDPNYSVCFVKNTVDSYFEWTGNFIGDLTKSLNKVPALKRKNLFYLYPTQQYVILEKYDTKTHIVELIKQIYKLNMIPYNLCIYKKRHYFMYRYIPFSQTEYSPNKKKIDQINDDERKIFVLHWILGIKGKYTRIDIPSDKNNIMGNITISKGKYTDINYEKNDFSSAAIHRYFYGLDHLKSIISEFKNEDDLEKIRCLFSQENYWWYQEIEKRLERMF